MLNLQAGGLKKCIIFILSVTWFYGDHHPWLKRDTSWDKSRVMHIHPEIMADMMWTETVCSLTTHNHFYVQFNTNIYRGCKIRFSFQSETSFKLYASICYKADAESHLICIYKAVGLNLSLSYLLFRLRLFMGFQSLQANSARVPQIRLQ